MQFSSFFVHFQACWEVRGMLVGRLTCQEVPEPMGSGTTWHVSRPGSVYDSNQEPCSFRLVRAFWTFWRLQDMLVGRLTCQKVPTPMGSGTTWHVSRPGSHSVPGGILESMIHS